MTSKPSPNDRMLRLEQLRVVLDGKLVIPALDLTIAAGERVVIAGPSGSGKSTLLRAIAGLAPVLSGQISIHGQEVSQQPPAQRAVGMMFQSYALLPHLSVQENLCFGLQVRGLKAADAKTQAQDMAARLGLSAQMQQTPKQLSGGERQRVALARLLLKRPKIMLLDEPLSNLDAQMRATARAEILSAHAKTDAALLMVTHDQAEAMAMAHRIGVMHEGRLLQIAAPQKVYAQPANLFVARFFGTPQMNILPVVVDLGGALRWQGMRLCTASQLAQLRPHATPAPQTEWQLGLRAEHLLLCGAESHHEGSAERSDLLHAEVVHQEHLGEQQIIWLQCADARLAMRLGPEVQLADKARVQVCFNLRQACWFHPQTGEALA